MFALFTGGPYTGLIYCTKLIAVKELLVSVNTFSIVRFTWHNQRRGQDAALGAQAAPKNLCPQECPLV